MAIWLLLDDEAVDVSRVTGIPWSWERVETRGARRPCIDVSRLDWWDQIRVAWTLVAGYYLTGGNRGPNHHCGRVVGGAGVYAIDHYQSA